MRKSVCVFCASSGNVPGNYMAAAARIGDLCAAEKLCLVNGAGDVGLMGACSDACLHRGGHVIGVIPRFMVERGWGHRSLPELVITDNMATRRQRMRELSDGVIALPGGCGTLEELFETITQRQMGFYPHPVILLNTDGFYDGVIAWWKRAFDERFMRSDQGDLLSVAHTPDEAIHLFKTLPDRNLTEEKLKER